jgi:Holliday junction resolvase RusA-like endonuclease
MTEAAVIICVHGNPLPKQSFAYTANGGGYTKRSVKDWQDIIGWKAHEAMIDRRVMECPVEVEITFWRKTRGRADLDNLSKCCLDALKGIVFSDDCQVVELHLKKFINREYPGCRIRVAPAKENEWVDQEMGMVVW